MKLKKLLGLTLALGVFMTSTTTVFANTAVYADDTETTFTVQNYSPLRGANAHSSERTIESKGKWGQTRAYVYSPNQTVYYLEATMKATYSNGQVNGGSSTKSKNNSSEVSSDKVYESGPKRQYHSSSRAKNYSSDSFYETASGSSSIFD